MKRDKSCKMCLYYRGSAWRGFCHRHAPIARHLITIDEYKTSGGMWPPVEAAYWCGDYEQDVDRVFAEAEKAQMDKDVREITGHE